MKELILIKYGEIILKGLNRHIFEDKLIANIQKAVGDDARIYKSLATIYAEPREGADTDELIKKIGRVFGIVWIVRAGVCSKELSEISEAVNVYLKDTLERAKTFKVETKRADKRYPLKSPEVSREVGGTVLSSFPNLKVDVKNPDVQVNDEIRDTAAYIYADRIAGRGGMPTGTSGKAMLLLSGGIDSPVAGYMIAKRGAVLEGIHFFSHPFTSEMAKQKVLDLAKIVSGYCGKMRVHIVPFTQPQLDMRDKCPAEHLTLLMRRMMMMISCEIAKREGAICLVTGESLGQVASQTMEAIAVTDNAADMPCFRPLIGMDKEDIVKIARDIGTYETSILPYEDCCTIFVPKHPTTRPQLEKILQSEKLLDVETLVREAVEGAETVEIG